MVAGIRFGSSFEVRVVTLLRLSGRPRAIIRRPFGPVVSEAKIRGYRFKHALDDREDVVLVVFCLRV